MPACQHEHQCDDWTFLKSFNLRLPQLRDVRRCVESGDLRGARAALVAYFNARRRPRWFFDLRGKGRRDMPLFPWAFHVPAEESLRRADALLENRFILSEDITVHFDERLRWRTKALVGGPVPGNMFKWCSFLLDLSRAYAATGKAVYARKFAELAQRWLDDWPLITDENFNAGSSLFSYGRRVMPEGFRCVTFLCTLYSGVLDSPRVPARTAFGLIKSVWFVGLQLRTFATDSYRAGNHHLWHRGAVPFMLGLMFPEVPELAALRDQGAPVIRAHARRAFLADGSYEERSASYAKASMMMFLMPVALAAANREPLLSARSTRALRRCLDSLAGCVMPDGRLPDLGDSPTYPWQVMPFLALGADLLGSRAASSAVLSLNAGRLVSAPRRARLRRLPPVRLPLVVYRPDGGMFVARDAWSKTGSAMLMAIPGPGYVGHSHDEALNLQLVARGVPVVGTPASVLYIGVHQVQYDGKPIRGHFYGMTSHNVLLVGGEPAASAEQLAKGWGPQLAPLRSRWQRTPDGVRVTASHTAYPGTRLSRRVTFRHGQGWRVVDRVTGGAARPHLLRWHFEFGVEVERDGDGVVASARGVQLRVCVAASGVGRLRLYRDRRWMGTYCRKVGLAVPWVLDVPVTTDRVSTRFDIL